MPFLTILLARFHIKHEKLLCIELVNGKVRDKRLNWEIFYTLQLRDQAISTTSGL
jgi:hypothetical protein